MQTIFSQREQVLWAPPQEIRESALRFPKMALVENNEGQQGRAGARATISGAKREDGARSIFVSLAHFFWARFKCAVCCGIDLCDLGVPAVRPRGKDRRANNGARSTRRGCVHVHWRHRSDFEQARFSITAIPKLSSCAANHVGSTSPGRCGLVQQHWPCLPCPAQV